MNFSYHPLKHILQVCKERYEHGGRNCPLCKLAMHLNHLYKDDPCICDYCVFPNSIVCVGIGSELLEQMEGRTMTRKGYRKIDDDELSGIVREIDLSPLPYIELRGDLRLEDALVSSVLVELEEIPAWLDGEPIEMWDFEDFFCCGWSLVEAR